MRKARLRGWDTDTDAVATGEEYPTGRRSGQAVADGNFLPDAVDDSVE